MCALHRAYIQHSEDSSERVWPLKAEGPQQHESDCICVLNIKSGCWQRVVLRICFSVCSDMLFTLCSFHIDSSSLRASDLRPDKSENRPFSISSHPAWTGVRNRGQIRRSNYCKQKSNIVFDLSV